MAGYRNLYQQVASRPAVQSRFSFFPNPDTLTVVNTRWNGDTDGLPAGYITAASAVRAFLPDYLSTAVAVRTSLHILYGSEEGLGSVYHLALSSALRTSLR